MVPHWASVTAFVLPLKVVSVAVKETATQHKLSLHNDQLDS